MYSACNNLEVPDDHRSNHETFAFRWSVTLLDVQLALIIVVDDDGLQLDIRCGGTGKSQKDL